MCGLILFLTIFLIPSSSGLNIISRQDWGARPPKSTQILPVNPPTHVVIHHSGTTQYKCSNEAECKATVKTIQDFHMNGNNWQDIGYNFLVGKDGNIYEGRGWSKRGAHSPGFNKKSMGICFIGDFTNQLPSQQQMDAAKDLIDFGVKNNLISTNYKLVGHRQDTLVNTACPGNKLFEEIQHWKHFTRNI